MLTDQVGHIEDVVVNSKYRKHRLGLMCANNAARMLYDLLYESVVNALKQIALSKGCYKVILDCSETNVGFYERCGFSRKEVQMAFYRSKL